MSIVPFESFYQRALVNQGGEANLRKKLPSCLPQQRLAATSDDRWLATMTKCVFRAGFVWRVIEQKWDGFELAFSGFNPKGMAFLSEEAIDRLAQDERIVRNRQKILTVRENAQFINDITEEHGSFGQFVAHWPEDNIVALWLLLKKRGARLGGNSGPMVLREMGKDTFLVTGDVGAALQTAGVVDKTNPSSQRDLAAVQAAFNQWREESGLRLCEISRVLSYAVG